MAANRPTNFFQRQTQARSSCQKLVLLFIATVFLIIVALYFALRLIWYLYFFSEGFHTSSVRANYSLQKLKDFSFWDPSLFFFIATIVTLFILIASLIKMNQLQKGGGAVAQMLGGRRIPKSSHDPAERQLLNVVEEMAIASGIHVPQVYVLDQEKSINAFAAGLSLNDSAVAVTSGALNQLSRDELQGVIGHEFSHILNGDTRLNIQLIGIIYGILVIGIIGSKLIQTRARSGLLIITGVLLTIIGYTGSFMGRMIQSAVCRQRELLADASAVQFTRNPAGLANALKKIGGYIFGSRINSATASQASHLFFGESHPHDFFSGLLATHPPLLMRIKMLEPSFDGKFTKISVSTDSWKPLTQYTTPYGLTNKLHESSRLATVAPAEIVNHVGNPTKESLGHSQILLTQIPEQIRQILNTPQGAAAVISALLMGNDCLEREMQINALQRAIVLHGNIEDTIRLCDIVSGLGDEVKLPLVEIAIPSLRTLTSMEKRNFLIVINSMITADGKVTLFEFTVQWILNKLLSEGEDFFSKATFFSISQVGLDILIILRALACAGNFGDAENARRSFDAGLARIPEIALKKPDFIYEENISFPKVGASLQKLTMASFKIKQTVIDACAHCAFADQTITIAEAELLRVIALAMNCPLPPFEKEK